MVEQAKTKPKSRKPLTAAQREALLATSRALGSLSKSAAQLAQKLDRGAGIVARPK